MSGPNQTVRTDGPTTTLVHEVVDTKCTRIFRTRNSFIYLIACLISVPTLANVDQIWGGGALGFQFTIFGGRNCVRHPWGGGYTKYII